VRIGKVTSGGMMLFYLTDNKTMAFTPSLNAGVYACVL